MNIRMTQLLCYLVFFCAACALQAETFSHDFVDEASGLVTGTSGYFANSNSSNFANDNLDITPGGFVVYQDAVSFNQSELDSGFTFDVTLSTNNGATNTYASAYVTENDEGSSGMNQTQFGISIAGDGVVILGTGSSGDGTLAFGSSSLDSAMGGTWDPQDDYTYRLSVDDSGAISLSFSSDGENDYTVTGSGTGDNSFDLTSLFAGDNDPLYLGFHGRNATFRDVELSTLAIPEVSQYGFLMGIICWAQACLRRRPWLFRSNKA